MVRYFRIFGVLQRAICCFFSTVCRFRMSVPGGVSHQKEPTEESLDVTNKVSVQHTSNRLGRVEKSVNMPGRVANVRGHFPGCWTFSKYNLCILRENTAPNGCEGGETSSATIRPTGAGRRGRGLYGNLVATRGSGTGRSADASILLFGQPAGVCTS